MTEVQTRQGMRNRRTDDLSTFSRNISTPAQQSLQEENIMAKQAMDISLHCWTQRSKSPSTNLVLHIQTPRGRNTDLVLGGLSQT